MVRILEIDDDENNPISFCECIKLAKKYSNKKNYEVALKYYNKALELNPNCCSAYDKRSEIYKMLNMKDEANLDSKIHHYLCNEYEYVTNEGKDVNFIPALKFQIQADILHEKYLLKFDIAANIQNKKTDTLEEAYIKKYKKAINLYTELLNENPNDWFLLYNRGICYHNLGKYTNALNDFSNSIVLNQKREKTYYYRSLVYKSLNMPDKAEADKKKIEELKAEIKIMRKPHSVLKEIEYMFGDIEYDDKNNVSKTRSTKGRKLDL